MCTCNHNAVSVGGWSGIEGFIYLFFERVEGKEKEREKNIKVWEPLAWPLLGTWIVS